MDGIHRLDSGNRSKAVKILKEFCRRYPASPGGHYQFATLLYQVGHLTEAEKACKKGLAIAPADRRLLELQANLFLHLTGTLHYGQTSRACNITRSGLTRTIQRLEQEIGEQLFLRDNRSVSLTRAGELFKAYAGDIIRRHRELQIQMAAEHNLTGELSLYCSTDVLEVTLKSPIFDKYIKIASIMPSAKY